MRIIALLAAFSLAALYLGPLVVSMPVAAQASLTRLEVTIGVDQTGRFVFLPNSILIPQLNITLNVTFRNNYTGSNAQNHTFTLRDSDGNVAVNTGSLLPNRTASVEFHILTLTNVSVGGTFFRPQSFGGGIRFICIPHEGAGMEGSIVLATLEPPSPEKGILIRAYWIGIIGIASTLFWLVISYFVIKSSSRHFSDHREHVRKGLP